MVGGKCVEMKESDHITSKAKAKAKSGCWNTTHKLGIQVPKPVEEACKLDLETGTDFWTKAISQQMAKVKVAFSCWDGGMLDEAWSAKLLVGFQEIGSHMVFDIKMDVNFTQKVRLVASSHKTVTPASVTRFSVVLQESMRLVFAIAGLGRACCQHVKCAFTCALSREELDGRRTRVWIGFPLCVSRCLGSPWAQVLRCILEGCLGLCWTRKHQGGSGCVDQSGFQARWF
jgi:hypothetical protein